MTTTPTLLGRIRTWLRSDMKVLRWVFLALYIALIAGLSTPFLGRNGGKWAWLSLAGVMVGSQALFIFGSGTIQLAIPSANAGCGCRS